MKAKFKYSDFAGKDPFPDWFIKFLRFLEFQFFKIKESIAAPTWAELDSPPTCYAVENRFHGQKPQVANANLFILEGNADLIAPYTNSPVVDTGCSLLNYISTNYITQTAFADSSFWQRTYSVQTGLWSDWTDYTGDPGPPFPKEDTYPLDRVPSGLLYTISAGDTNNDWTISPGWTWDTTFAKVIYLSSAITKRLDANWAVGNNQGGLDTGSKAANTTYFIWIILRSDTGVVDALFSTSSTSPTMPANYDYKRLIGCFKTDGSSNNIQVINEIWGNQVKSTLSTLVNEVNTSTLGTSRTTYTLANCPVTSGITSVLSCNCSKAATATFIAITGLSETDYTPTGTLNNMRGGSGAGGVAAVETTVKLNSSAQFGARADSTNVVFSANLKAYFYSRSI